MGGGGEGVDGGGWRGRQLTGACWVVTMYDSYGDGWDNAVYTITDSKGEVQATGTLEDEVSGTNELCDLAIECYTIFVSEGLYPNEVSWEITQGGVLVAEGGAGETVGGVCNDGSTTSPSMTMVPTMMAITGNPLSLSHSLAHSHSLVRVLPFDACMHGYNGSHRRSPSPTPMPSQPPYSTRPTL